MRCYGPEVEAILQCAGAEAEARLGYGFRLGALAPADPADPTSPRRVRLLDRDGQTVGVGEGPTAVLAALAAIADAIDPGTVGTMAALAALPVLALTGVG